MNQSDIPVAHGTAVDYHNLQQQPNGHSSAGNSMISSWADDGKIYSTHELRQQREDPPRQYKDAAWALAFILQLLLVVVMCLYLIGTGQGGNVQGGGSGYGGVFYVAGVCGALAVGLSTAALSFMMKNAKLLVESALIFSVATSFCMGVVGFMAGNLIMGAIGLVAGVVGCCYAYVVWRRIPFAAANLKTALSAVKSNLGLFLVALVVSGVAMGWSVLWFLGFGTALQTDSLVVVFFLFLSYYWTHEVLRNTIHVTTAVSVGSLLPTLIIFCLYKGASLTKLFLIFPTTGCRGNLVVCPRRSGWHLFTCSP